MSAKQQLLKKQKEPGRRGDYDLPGTLTQHTLKMLPTKEDELCRISVATGLPFQWLRNYRRNELRSHSVNRVQVLYEYLAGKSLPL